jgi:hypothetical protein
MFMCASVYVCMCVSVCDVYMCVNVCNCVYSLIVSFHIS